MLVIRRDIAGRVLGVIVAGAAMLSASVAVAEPASSAARMTLGAPAPAPSGFLDFCRRSPGDCTQTRDAASLDDVRARAASLYWAGVFDRSDDGAAIRVTASTGSPAFDWSRIFPDHSPAPVAVADPMNAGLAPAMDDVAVPALAVAVSDPVEGPGAVSAADFGVDVVAIASDDVPPILTMDKARWKRLKTINRDVNRRVRRGSDARLYGVADFWSAPQGRDARGDCEDYVLAKRRELIAQGFPAEALSIAIVTTAWDESHAVLLVATDEGEMVLDNLTPRISRWDRVNYRWGERQAPGKVFDWVRMAG